MDWRVTLDVPHTLCVEPGFERAVHCRDFRAGADAYNGTWREPTTGLLMLSPSFFNRDYFNQAHALTDWNVATGWTWRGSKRSYDLTAGFTSVQGVGFDPGLIDTLINTAIAAIEAASTFADTLKWAMISNFVLGIDEGFAIYHMPLTDELLRKYNWLYLQWSIFGVHLSQSGSGRVYMYDPNDMTATPTLWHKWEFGSPGDFNARGGYLIFIPIANYGLLAIHAQRQPRGQTLTGSAESIVSHSHLIPLPQRFDAQGLPYLFGASRIAIACNPYQSYHFSILGLQYPASGDYTDAPFDPGYKPSQVPASAACSVVPGRKATATASLQKADNSGTWVAGTDQKGRVKVSLTTDDTRYTPFVQGHLVAWNPITTTRNTTPVKPRVLKLNLTDDERGRLEGDATLFCDDPAIVWIVRRGDSTVLVENDDGSGWQPYFFGLAKGFKLKMLGGMGFPTPSYHVECKFLDSAEFLREEHWLYQSAYDSISVAESIRRVLRCRGFQNSNIVGRLETRLIPPCPDGTSWRFSPKLGDDGLTLVEKLMTYGRAQFREPLTFYDYASTTWYVQDKARDTTNPWTASPDPATWDEAARRIAYHSFESEPEPPECNSLIVQGTDRPDPQATKNTVCATNPASLSDPTSIDYLGRFVMGVYYAVELSDPNELKIMARNIERLAMHHGERATMQVDGFPGTLRTAMLVRPQDVAGNTLGDFWVKRRTVTVQGGMPTGYLEKTSYELDTMWEADLK